MISYPNYGSKGRIAATVVYVGYLAAQRLRLEPSFSADSHCFGSSH